MFGYEQARLCASILYTNLKKWQTENILMTKNRLEIAENFFINQIKQKNGNYHFGTSGTIHGLGYGPTFHRNENGHSIDQYSNSKFMFDLIFNK